MQHVIYQLIPINPHHSPQTIELSSFCHTYTLDPTASFSLFNKGKKINTFISLCPSSAQTFSLSSLPLPLNLSMCRLTHSLVFFEGRSRRYSGFYGRFLTLKENQLLSVTGMSMAAAGGCIFFFFAQRCSRGAGTLSPPCLECTV